MRLRERWRALAILRRYPELTDAVGEGQRARVTGSVRALGELLTAPLSGKACVAYAARGTGSYAPGAAHRLTVGEARQVRPFAIDRGELGSITIDGTAAIFALDRVALRDSAAREAWFLAFHGLRQPGHTFVEVVLEPDMRVTVGGRVMLAPSREPPSSERGFRDPPPLECTLVGDDRHPLVIAQP